MAPVARLTPATGERTPREAASTTAPPKTIGPAIGATAAAPHCWPTRIMARTMPKRMVEVLQISMACWRVTMPKRDHEEVHPWAP